MESVSGVLSCGVQKNLKILEGDGQYNDFLNQK